MEDIKFINDIQTNIINKLEFAKEKINSIASDITIDLRECITQFTDVVNIKIKNINNELLKQNTELELIRNELHSNKFDQSNYTNVSITKKQDKIIMERDNKIKELEQRIKFLENKNKEISTKETVKAIVNNIETKAATIESTIESTNDVEVLTVSKAKSKAKVKLPITLTEPKKKLILTKNKTKLPEPEIVIPEPEVFIPEPEVVIHEPEVFIHEPEVVIHEHEVVIHEPEVVIPEPEVVIPEPEKTTKSMKNDVKTDTKKDKKPIQLVDDTVKLVKKDKVVKKDTKKGSKKDTEPATSSIVVVYPDIIPTIDDVEVLELDIDYYMDSLNNVYQMTPDQDIGMFIGVYDTKNKKIILPK